MNPPFTGVPWGYLIASVYLALGVTLVLMLNAFEAWFVDLLRRVNEMEPDFAEGSMDVAMRLGTTREEITLKVNLLICLGWPIFIFVYTILYLAVRKFERYQNQMDYLDEKYADVADVKAELLAAATDAERDNLKEALWAAEMNLKGAQKAMEPPWYDRLYWRLKYGKAKMVGGAPEPLKGCPQHEYALAECAACVEVNRKQSVPGGIFSDDPVEDAKQSENAYQVAKLGGCVEHVTLAVFSCPECRELPHVQKVVEDLKARGLISSDARLSAVDENGKVWTQATEEDMPMFKHDKRERRPFILHFDVNGCVGEGSWSIQKPVAGPDGTTVVADCCADCVQSDQNAMVTDASPNAKHFLEHGGYVPARSHFLAHDAKEKKIVFTSDGKSGFVAGFIVRDVC